MWCLRRRYLIMRILSRRPCATTLAATAAPLTVGAPTLTPSPEPSRSTWSKLTAAPTSASSFSTRRVSPCATRYCLPPVMMTAYIGHSSVVILASAVQRQPRNITFSGDYRQPATSSVIPAGAAGTTSEKQILFDFELDTAHPAGMKMLDERPARTADETEDAVQDRQEDHGADAADHAGRACVCAHSGEHRAEHEEEQPGEQPERRHEGALENRELEHIDAFDDHVVSPRMNGCATASQP